MPLDITSAGIGLGVGVLATVLVRELAFRRIQNKERTRLTREWGLSIGRSGPVRVAAARLDELDLPPGSKVLVPRGAAVPAGLGERCEVREAPQVPGNFALLKGSALVFAAPPGPGAAAVWSSEPQVQQRLHDDWQKAWAAASPRVPRASVAALSRYEGQVVEVSGAVREVAARDGMHYLRLTERGIHATIATAEPVGAVRGQVVRAVGTVTRAAQGSESVVRATRVEAVPAA